MDQLTRQDFKRLHEMPASNITVPVEHRYNDADLTKIMAGFRATDMDQRWNLYYEHDKLHMHRSWTGHCIYIAQFVPSMGGGATLTNLTISTDLVQHVNVDAESATETALSVIQHYLIDRVWDSYQ